MNLSIQAYRPYTNFAGNRKSVTVPNPNSDYSREDVYNNGRVGKTVYDNGEGDVFVINRDGRGRVIPDPLVSNYKDSGFIPNPCVNFFPEEDD